MVTEKQLRADLVKIINAFDMLISVIESPKYDTDHWKEAPDRHMYNNGVEEIYSGIEKLKAAYVLAIWRHQEGDLK